MSVEVASEKLAETLEQYDFSYLITVSDEARSHVVAVSPTLSDGVLTVVDLGRRTRMNAEAHPSVTLVWPPTESDGYSLIVDGDAVLSDVGLELAVSRAVLHRPAPAPNDVAEGQCGSDCVELPT